MARRYGNRAHYGSDGRLRRVERFEIEDPSPRRSASAPPDPALAARIADTIGPGIARALAFKRCFAPSPVDPALARIRHQRY